MTGYHRIRIHEHAGQWRMVCSCGNRSRWASRVEAEDKANQHSHIYSGSIQMTPVVIR